MNSRQLIQVNSKWERVSGKHIKKINNFLLQKTSIKLRVAGNHDFAYLAIFLIQWQSRNSCAFTSVFRGAWREESRFSFTMEMPLDILKYQQPPAGHFDKKDCLTNWQKWTKQRSTCCDFKRGSQRQSMGSIYFCLFPKKFETAGKKYTPTPQDRNGYGEFKVKGKINPGVERYKERRIRKGAPANCQQGMQIWLTTS